MDDAKANLAEGIAYEESNQRSAIQEAYAAKHRVAREYGVFGGYASNMPTSGRDQIRYSLLQLAVGLAHQRNEDPLAIAERFAKFVFADDQPA